MTGGLFEVVLERQARKNLAALDPPVRRRVAACIEDLATQPRPPGATEIRGRPEVLRIALGTTGSYEIRDSQLIVLIVTIGHRRDIYR